MPTANKSAIARLSGTTIINWLKTKQSHFHSTRLNALKRFRTILISSGYPKYIPITQPDTSDKIRLKQVFTNRTRHDKCLKFGVIPKGRGLCTSVRLKCWTQIQKSLKLRSLNTRVRARLQRGYPHITKISVRCFRICFAFELSGNCVTKKWGSHKTFWI